VAVDLPGFGRPNRRTPRARLRPQVRFLRRLLDTLGWDLGRTPRQLDGWADRVAVRGPLPRAGRTSRPAAPALPFAPSPSGHEPGRRCASLRSCRATWATPPSRPAGVTPSGTTSTTRPSRSCWVRPAGCVHHCARPPSRTPSSVFEPHGGSAPWPPRRRTSSTPRSAPRCARPSRRAGADAAAVGRAGPSGQSGDGGPRLPATAGLDPRGPAEGRACPDARGTRPLPLHGQRVAPRTRRLGCDR
jgi:hypothetical protein